jgi:type II secretory pathway component PulM
MLSRLSDAINLLLLRFGEWFGDLSPAGKRMVAWAIILLLMVATYFGLLPGRHVHYNPHSLVHW